MIQSPADRVTSCRQTGTPTWVPLNRESKVVRAPIIGLIPMKCTQGNGWVDSLMGRVTISVQTITKGAFPMVSNSVQGKNISPMGTSTSVIMPMESPMDMGITSGLMEVFTKVTFNKDFVMVTVYGATKTTHKSTMVATDLIRRRALEFINGLVIKYTRDSSKMISEKVLGNFMHCLLLSRTAKNIQVTNRSSFFREPGKRENKKLTNLWTRRLSNNWRTLSEIMDWILRRKERE